MATATDPLSEITPPNAANSLWIASLLFQHLGPFVLTHQLGWAVIEMILLIDPAKNLQRRPDLAFVSSSRWPLDREIPEDAAWDVVPELAAEVVSPSNSVGEIMTKIEDYFRAGVRLVWVIHPKHRKVYIYDSPTSVRILQAGDALDGGAVVPGFQFPVGALFRGLAGAPPAP
jgi:Uma2 family endonuclease